MLTSKTVQEFLDETASNSPAPGGGSVSALAAALGMALTSMVCRLTIGKKKYAEVQEEMDEILRKSEDIRTRCTAIIEEDTLAFNKVMAAYGLPKNSEDEKIKRNTAIQEATKAATLVPWKLMQLCEEGMKLTQRVAEKGNVNSISDAGVAALMLHAACAGAELNVKINLKSIAERSFVENVAKELDTVSRNASNLAETIRTIVWKAMS
jgi:formiminotetrahydrofolate cyclodeaminase